MMILAAVLSTLAICYGIYLYTKQSRKTPLDDLKHALRTSPGYAQSWHANLSMEAQDCGVDRDTANEIATRFMQRAFDV